MGRYDVVVCHVGTLYYVNLSSVGPVRAIHPDCGPNICQPAALSHPVVRLGVLHLHAGHVPHIDPGIWAKSPITRLPWFTGSLLSIRMLGRPPMEPSGSYVLVLSALSLTTLVVVFTVA